MTKEGSRGDSARPYNQHGEREREREGRKLLLLLLLERP